MKLKQYIKEASGGFILQEYLFGWYQNDKVVYKTLIDAKKAAQKKYDSIMKGNKKAEKDWRPKSYGKIEIRPTRVVNLSTGEKHPATKYDEKNFKTMSKEYLKEEIERRIYFGHPRLYYNTKWETKAIQMIQKKWPNHIVLNPNQRNRFEKSVKKSGFKIFYTLVDRCEFGAFMLMEDGRWGGGIYKEAEYMEKQGKKIWEVNPWKGYIKKTTTRGVTPIGKDDAYYKKFTYDE